MKVKGRDAAAGREGAAARRLIRPSTQDDRPRIATLLDRVLGKVPADTRYRLWDWRSHENPAATPDIPEFLVVEDDDEIVAAVGLFPVRCSVGDRSALAVSTCDFAVDPDARGAGMPLKMRALKLGDLSFSTSANPDASKLTLALGGKAVPAGRAAFLKVLRISGLLERRVRGWISGSGSEANGTGRAEGDGPKWSEALVLAARTAGTMANGALRVARGTRRTLSRRTRSRLASTEPVIHFDERFDRLWERVSADIPVAVRRDAAYLGWRYGSCPFPGVEAFAVIRRSEAAAFGACHHGRDEDGLRFTLLLDLFGVDDSAREAVLERMLVEAEAAGSQYVSARTGSAPLQRLVERRGFVRRERQHSRFIFKSNRPDLDDVLGDPENWHISFGDGDMAFFFQRV